jgi:Cu/Ag efflux pump CusA
MQTISVNVTGRPVSDVVHEAQALINQNIVMPVGTYALFSGEDEARVQSQRDILAYGAMASLGIVILLFLALKGRRSVVLVLANLPFALVGGVLIVALTGGSLTLGSMVGFITLFGISLRNSIMLISHYENLVYAEGMTWGIDAAVQGAAVQGAAVQGAAERLVPILMTALVTALALLPLALSSGESGNEIEGPMAIVILGGLVTSTLLNLIVLPTLSLRYFR